ncbi:MAG: DUF3298 domain-containing protein [Anaeromicrobium sp.]|jgi:hypothetical protein|uniref:DUF3298 domain-containing protein n=1 Tax=Anaeromicrobium sp. TaxID=1929132 RepID=UPI0025D6E65A|nr:DUF3298 domain-containing protein [Anaeromicrobium sp.]MCT4592839.1 DUF3298 domain-containing protein [Anaeromicrobium sp.]
MGRIIVRIMAVAMLGGVLLFAPACESAKIATSVSSVTREKPKVISENISIDKPYIKVKGNSIKLEGMSHKDVQGKINNHIKYELEDHISLKTQDEKYIYDEFNKDDEEYEPKEVNVVTRSTYEDENLLSVVISINTRESENYSYEIKNTYNIDLKTGQDVGLGKLFKGKDYLEVIEKYIKEEIDKNPEDYNTSSVKISLNEEYYLEEDNLVIVFKPGTIGSYSKGYREFRIPIESFGQDFSTNMEMESSFVVVDRKQIVVDDNNLKGILNIPVIKAIEIEKDGIDYEEIQDNLNNLFENEIMDFRDKMYEDGKAAMEESEKIGYTQRPYVANVTFDEKYNRGNLLSIYITYYTYTGGAHGNHEDVAYNVDLNNGKILKLKDIFKNDNDYKKIINDEINKQIKDIHEQAKAEGISRGEKVEDIYLPYEGFESIRDDQGFYFKDDSLVIYFGLYEIGPYAAGIVEFPIKISHIGDSLKDEYVIK